MNSKLKEVVEKIYKITDTAYSPEEICRSIVEIRELAILALAAPPEPVGNNAKMREVLERIKECYENDYLSLGRDSGDVLGNAALLAENALALPPRNCDIFRDHEEAWVAYKRIAPNGGYFDAMTLWDFIKWLFAETKGENDESE